MKGRGECKFIYSYERLVSSPGTIIVNLYRLSSSGKIDPNLTLVDEGKSLENTFPNFLFGLDY